MLERWDAAKKLMASREMAAVVQKEEFTLGWQRIEAEASSKTGLEQLLAIDLLMRVSAFVKKLKARAVVAVRAALRSPIPPLVPNLTTLPPDSKPAEIRENVASALEYATGTWVEDYVFSSLIGEDRSQRCRDELVRRAAERQTTVDQWFRSLLSNPEFEGMIANTDLSARASRLREFLVSFEIAVRENKRTLNATIETGQLLSDLCRRMVPLGRSDKIPPALGAAAVAATELLDDIVGMRPTLIVEPEIYSTLEVFRNWWMLLPYPKDLQNALGPIREKIRSAVVLRARLGQRSEELSNRLVASYGNQERARAVLSAIADTEVGLNSEIVDWLKGRTRTSGVGGVSAATALRAVALEDQTRELAALMVQAWEIQREALDDATVIRFAENVIGAGNRQGLRLLWVANEEVEYVSVAHETLTGAVPPEPFIRVIRPAVVRMRPGGIIDYVVRAKVGPVNART